MQKGNKLFFYECKANSRDLATMDAETSSAGTTHKVGIWYSVRIGPRNNSTACIRAVSSMNEENVSEY